MRVARAGSRLSLKISKPAAFWSVAFGNQLSREVAMSRKKSLALRAAIAAALLLPASALASQGPGGGMGTASNLTQVAMAILVYGASALIVGTGLIGALRGDEVAKPTLPSS
jgi:hypothetical protein